MQLQELLITRLIQQNMKMENLLKLYVLSEIPKGTEH